MKSTENMKILGRVIGVDLKRAFISGRFLISILMGIGVCYFTLLFCGFYQVDVYYAWVKLHDKSQSMLAYLVGGLPYALCFYEDFSHGNIKNAAGRIDLKKYTLSKTIAALLAATASFVLAKLAFVFFFSLQYPMRSSIYDSIQMTGADYFLYFQFLKKGYDILYYFVVSLHRGLYCAVLCQLVMMVSLLIPNKAVIFSLPMTVFYVFNFYIANKAGQNGPFNITHIFNGDIKLWPQDWMGFLYAFLTAMFFFWMIYHMTVWTLQRKIYEV